MATQCGVNNSILGGGGGSSNNISGGINKIPSTHHHHLNHPSQTNYMINPQYSVASSDINSPTLIINQQQQQNLYQNHPSSGQNLKFNNQIQYTNFNPQQQLHHQQQKQQLQQQQQQLIKTSINNRENSNNNESNCADDEDFEDNDCDNDCDNNSSINIDNHTADDNQVLYHNFSFQFILYYFVCINFKSKFNLFYTKKKKKNEKFMEKYK